MKKYVICISKNKIIYSGSNLILIKFYDKLFEKNMRVRRFKFNNYDDFKRAELRLKSKEIGR